jgi:hypothetical protein
VHCAHGVADLGSREGRTHHTDAGFRQEASSSAQNVSINPFPQLVGLLSRQDRRALDGHTPCQQDLIANSDPSFSDKTSRVDLAEHLPDEKRAVQALGNFRVPAAERDAQFFAAIIVSAISGVVRFSGRSMTTKNHNGRAPRTATSFALT